MSEAAPSDPTPREQFEAFKDFASKLIAVPKAEIEEKEREWREARKPINANRKPQAPR